VEARAVNDIAHENIVEITDFVDAGDGRPFYIMELLEGETLAERLRDPDPISFKELASLMSQLLDALQAAHEKGIVHCDLKPANIFLTKKRTVVKLLDFGIAKLVQDEDAAVSGEISGTPQYMSPEQAGGRPVDHRADLYAVGIVLYEMLSGRLPFDAENLVEMLLHHHSTPPPPLSAIRPVPPRLEALVMACLAKKPEERPASAAEIKSELNAIIEELERPPAPTEAKPEAPVAKEKRLGSTALLLIGAACLAFAVGFVAVLSSRTPRSEPIRVVPLAAPEKPVHLQPVEHVEPIEDVEAPHEVQELPIEAKPAPPAVQESRVNTSKSSRRPSVDPRTPIGRQETLNPF
jgi:serine/threonine-protein kinase